MARYFLLVVVVLFTGCERKLQRSEYIGWIRDYDHGLHVRKEVSGFIYEIQYQPADYMLLQRYAGSIDAVAYEKEKLAMDSMQYYVLTVGNADTEEDFIKTSGSDPVEQQERLYYFSYQFQNDIRLIQNGRELPCVLFHFERSVDMKSARTFVLGFDNPDAGSKESEFVIHSYRLGSAPVTIKVSKENIPSLQL